jgi:hypothetical protein
MRANLRRFRNKGCAFGRLEQRQTAVAAMTAEHPTQRSTVAVLNAELRAATGRGRWYDHQAEFAPFPPLTVASQIGS